MRIGPVELDTRLARGGMAEVWAAHIIDDASDDDDGDVIAAGAIPHDVALCVKRLDPSVVSDADFVEMFRDEARLALAFAHDNVVRTYALLDDNPTSQPQELALVMERLDGASLASIDKALRRASAPMTPKEAIAIAMQLARGLHHVHTATDDGEPLSVVHRDVSPHNVMITTDARAVLIDFGVARAASRLTRTRTGLLKGKAAYMAPEHVRGEDTDARADQFAWGAVVWELLCGRMLFAGADELRVLSRIERPEVTPPSAIVDLKSALGVEGARIVDDVVLRALSQRPSDRFVDLERAALALARLNIDEADVMRGLSARAQQYAQHEEEPVLPAAKTRIVSRAQQEVLVREETVPPPQPSPPPLMAIAVVVGLLLLLGLLLAMAAIVSSSSSRVALPPAVVFDNDDDARARARSLEAVLTQMPVHPCRVELQGELVQTRTLTATIVTELEQDLRDCDRAIAAHNTAKRRLDVLKKRGPLVPDKPPANARAKKERAEWLKTRTRIALDAGDASAVELAEAIVTLAPDDKDAHRLLFDAYRRAGKTAPAGLEARALIRLTGDDSLRLRRWLADHDLPAQ